MPRADWIRAASDDDIAINVVDPLLVAAQSRASWDAFRPAERALVSVWTLHAIACRNGLASFVAEEEEWISSGVASAARDLDLDRVADGWEAATRGMELAKWRGENPGDVQWGNPAARESLEHELVAGRYAGMTSILAAWIREHADEFARMESLA
jgi:hypothetical protein